MRPQRLIAAAPSFQRLNRRAPEAAVIKEPMSENKRVGAVSGLGEMQRYLSSFQSLCALQLFRWWDRSLCLLLSGVRCAPKRARIDSIWIEFEHCVIELARGHGCFVQAVEIAKVLPRLGNDAGIIVVFRHLVPGDHGFRFQGLKLVERGDPLKPALGVGLAEIGMNSVVDGVPGNNQSDRRDVQAGGVSRIGPPRVHRDKLVALQLQIFERFGNHQPVRNLAGEKPTPEVLDPAGR